MCVFVALKDAPVTAFGAGSTEYTCFAGFCFVLLESPGFGLIVVPCSVAAQYFSGRTCVVVFLRMVFEMIQVKIRVWGVGANGRNGNHNIYLQLIGFYKLARGVIT